MALSALIVICSCIGLFTPGFYLHETVNWQLQSLTQDAIDLFLIAPLLLVTSWLANRNKQSAAILRAGVILYILYTFTIYCFDVHFNNLFILYCFILGLSFYSFLHFLFTQGNELVAQRFKHKSVLEITAFYLLIVSCVFYFQWLSEIIPAIIAGTIPKSLADAGLFTNPVHVIDLSVFLPGLFVTGILMLRQKPLGLLLAPVMIVFFVLMDITIGMLTEVMNAKGIEVNLWVAVVMVILAVFSLAMLIWYLRSIDSTTQSEKSFKVLLKANMQS
jgi:hypothetical protein